MSTETFIDGKLEAARITGGVTLVTIWGITLNEWAAMLAIAYTGLQIVLLLPRVTTMVKGWLCTAKGWFCDDQK